MTPDWQVIRVVVKLLLDIAFWLSVCKLFWSIARWFDFKTKTRNKLS